MIDLAHTVSAYSHGATPATPGEWQPDEAFQAGDFGACSTQQILDYLFMTCRNDRHGGDGSIYKERWFVDACNEVRRRILRSRESDLSQEEMLRAPVVIPYRPLKDPRDIRMLDPACGSMHFGLYAFDLYLKIYDEYWDLCSDSSFRVPATKHRLPTEEYADNAAWMIAAPKLIIEHNIHGIDIDPRAVQIAGLSLWLRAQRAWKAQGIAASDRPQVTRSNVVCAEPMPGDQKQLAEFCKTLHPAIAQMVTAIFEDMKLAGEAGSLLKIEEQINSLVAAAKKQWEKEPKVKQLELFSASVVKEQQLEFDLSGITDEQFFEKAEEEIYGALREFASETSEGGFRRKLFAGDAEKGFAFIELCSRRYDCALMNPPFGQPVKGVKQNLAIIYPKYWNDIYAMVIARSLALLGPDGLLGAITSSTFLNLAKFEDFRQLLIEICELNCLAELGSGVMDDAAVAAAAYIVNKSITSRKSVALFANVSNSRDRELVLREFCSLVEPATLFAKELHGFTGLPNKILAYWIPDRVFELFGKLRSLKQLATCTLGLDTRGNEDRFFRLWWEPIASDRFTEEWPVVTDGGNPQHFQRELRLVVNWKNNADELGVIASKASGGTFTGRDYYFQPGLTYIFTGQTTFSVQPLRAGSIFAKSAHAIFPNAEKDRIALLAILNSESVRLLLKVINPNRFFQTAYVKLLPIPEFHDIRGKLEELVNTIIQDTHANSCGDECSRNFRSDWSVSDASGESFSFVRIVQISRDRTRRIRNCKAEIDQLVQAAYGLNDHDIKFLQTWVGDSTAQEMPGEDGVSKRGVSFAAESLVSYLVGLVFGRFDLKKNISDCRVATDVMFQSWKTVAYPKDGLAKSDKVYACEAIQSQFADSVREQMENVFGSEWESVESAICSTLSIDSIASYIRDINGFFQCHFERYTKSRRYAPLYWPISTESGSYTLWFYSHHITDQTLYKAVNDFVEPKLKDDVKPQLNKLRAMNSRSSTQEKELAQLAELECELERFKADLLQIAAFWKPNLNDGVQITAAPLWKFFRHTAWRNKLKKTWEELQAGDYDWAHLALSIWPERIVKEKCTIDRSIAIAHDLEDKLWHEVEIKATSKTGKVTTKTEWEPRKLSEAELDAIVAEVKRR